MPNLTCRHAEHLFDAYLDGELAPGLAAELDAHRLTCSSCRHALALLEVAGHVVKADRSAATLSAGFTERLLACIDQPGPIPFWRRRPALWIGGSGLAAAAIALAVVMIPPSETHVLPFKDTKGNVTAEDIAAGPAAPLPANDLKQRVDQQLSEVRRSTEALSDFGKLTIMQILDRFGFEKVEPRDMFDVNSDGKPARTPAPTAQPSAADIEDL